MKNTKYVMLFEDYKNYITEADAAPETPAASKPATEKGPTDTEIKNAIFKKIAFPTTRQEYSKLLSNMTGATLSATGNKFSIIRDYILGLSNDAVKYSQITTGQEENLKAGILAIKVTPLKIDANEISDSALQKEVSYVLNIKTQTKEVASVPNILSIEVEYEGTVMTLKQALLIPLLIITEDKKYVWMNDTNSKKAKEIVTASYKMVDKVKQSNIIEILLNNWDKAETVTKRVNSTAKNIESANDELLASVDKTKIADVLKAYDKKSKEVLTKGLAAIKSVGKGNDVATEDDTNESKEYKKYGLPLNESKSCKKEVCSFLEKNDCEVDYDKGECTLDGKTMKIEKALSKFKASKELIDSYNDECSK